MPGELSGKVVLVTGGAQGIGRACALAYSREGATVVIADRDVARAQETVSELAGALAVECNVANGEQVEQSIRETLKHYGRLDAVHNNVGIAHPSKPLHQTTEEEWDQLLNVNLKSVYWTCRHGVDALARSRGSILNTASMVGIIGQKDHAAYVATKGGMNALTKAMALDYAPLGIRVNAICPAGVWTPMLEKWCGEQENADEIRKYLDEIHLLGYCPQPDVVADAAVFLLSERARFITGCILPVSGGAELGYRR